MGKVEAYSEFWKAKVREYGLADGLDKIIDLLNDLDCKDYFELGIGTGWPIACSLIDSGKNVYGCDLSAQSVLDAINDYPLLYKRAYAGPIDECLKHYDMKFDCVYCIRSSWHMKDFPANELQSMLELTKSEGYVIFNIINRVSSANKKITRFSLKNMFRVIIYRVICACKLVFLDEDYSGQMKQYYYTDREIRECLEGYEVKSISGNQLEFGLNMDFDADSQKILYIVKKQ